MTRPEDVAGLASFRLSHALSVASPRELGEPLQRRIVSDVYYGAFHLAREVAFARKYPGSKGPGSHKQLWDWFKTHGVVGHNVAASGSALQTFRETADYDIHYDLDFTLLDVKGYFDDFGDDLNAFCHHVRSS